MYRLSQSVCVFVDSALKQEGFLFTGLVLGLSIWSWVLVNWILNK